MISITFIKTLRSLASIFLIIIACNSAKAQLDWTEHLSHDRITRNNLGFLFEDNNLILVMDNYSGGPSSVERITGNVKKDIIAQFDSNYDAKSRSTAIDSKEVILTNPQSLDFYGFGATSIRMTNGDLSIRSLESIVSHPCIDALIPMDTTIPSECLTDFEFNHLLVNHSGEILESYEASPMIMHEGILGNYRVQNNRLYTHSINDTSFIIEVPNFKKLYNNPFTNELVILLDSTIIYYDPITLELEESILETKPIAIDFTEDAMYYLSKVGPGHKIFKSYYSGGSNLWMDIDPTPNGQEVEIYEISIKDLDAYLFGIHNDQKTKTRHHIVQRQNLLAPIGPPRRDLAIESFSVVYEELDYGSYEYTYEIKVINNGSSIVNTFDIYSDLKEYNELLYSDIDYTYNGNLQPDEVISIQGNFSANAISEININIPGADFMFDSYPNDNSASFDLISSNKETNHTTISISPNPTTGIIELDFLDFNNPNVAVIDIYGRQVLRPKITNNRIDISSIPNGLYYLQVIDENQKSTVSIVKI